MFLGLKVTEGSFVLLSNDDPQEDLDMALHLVVQAMSLTDSEKRKVRARVRIISLQGDPGLKTFTSTAGNSVSPTGLEEMVLEAVADISDLVGIAIDTLRQFAGGSTNDDVVIINTVAAATEIARRTGAYVVLPHHTGKQNYRDGVADMYCGSGSAAIADNCRFVLLLQTATWPDIESKVRRTGQERGNPLVLASTRGSLLMKPMEPIFLYRKDYFIGRVEGASLTMDQQLDDKDRKALRAVAGGASSKRSIFAAVGGNKNASSERVDDLLQRGHLVISGTKGGTDSFALSASGSRFLETSE